MRVYLSRHILSAILCVFSLSSFGVAQVGSQLKAALQFNFDGDVKSETLSFEGQNYTFVEGINGLALSLRPDNGFNNLRLDQLALDGTEDFSVQFWIKTTSKKPMVILSQKEFSNKGMTAQKNAGWALYCSSGTFAWNMASGSRRLNYERDNGRKLPINDGKWHMIAMTYNKALSEIRLYYDGRNKAIYNVGFDFVSNQPLVIGSVKNDFDYDSKILPEIEEGAAILQSLVDEFNSLGFDALKSEEFISLVVAPKKLFEEKHKELDPSKTDLITKLKSKDLKRVNDLRDQLLLSPYTIHQIEELTLIKPLNKLYALREGKVVIDPTEARRFTKQEQLFPSDFAMDNLDISESVLSAEEVLRSFTEYRKTRDFKYKKNLKELTVGVWNIWHGGMHFTAEADGWDSRLRIVEMIKKKNVDVILMQETYSSGDFIAAELGYYFATTSDWDYRMQGSNISVLSRYPIKELDVLQEAEFMNVSVKLSISEKQEIYAMSNWYGMNVFPAVYDFHETRFKQADDIPIVFGGDFNAVPHTDGGDSPASKKMLGNGFTDAYRSLHPDVNKFPAYTHSSGVRIDQLYYKGSGLENKSTEVIFTWPSGFPSDHFLILSKFRLNY